MVRSNIFGKVTMILALLLTTTTLFAQFSAGPRIGVNLANLRGSSVDGNGMILGYNIGGFVNYSMKDALSGDIAEMLSIQAELSVETKGTKSNYLIINGESLPDVQKVKQNFTYLQIPVLAKFSFESGSDLGYFGEAGFFMGALIGLAVDGNKSWDHDFDNSTDLRKYREEYSGFDFGLAIGGGVTYPLPFDFLGDNVVGYANARYCLGLSNIGEAKKKTPEMIVPLVDDVKTGTISLLFGLAYTF
ncbi:MAG: PorT family protein [Bacteroidales bacterium]|nr:PorT family protein [Bacteroidales bacterium]